MLFINDPEIFLKRNILKEQTSGHFHVNALLHTHTHTQPNAKKESGAEPGSGGQERGCHGDQSLGDSALGPLPAQPIGHTQDSS